MSVQIRVVIPNASPAPEDCTGSTGSRDSVQKAAPRQNDSRARPARNSPRPRPASAPAARPQLPVKPRDVTMHVASTYDVENEHDYIMSKALQAYHQHRDSEEKWQDIPLSPPYHHNHHHHNSHHSRLQRRRLQSSSSSNDSCPSSPTSSAAPSSSPQSVAASFTSPSSSSLLSSSSSSPERRRRGFKLALCTLKEGQGRELWPAPHSHSSSGPGFSPLPNHRPWSAVPHGRLQVSLASDRPDRGKTARNVRQHFLHVHTFPLPSKMDPPISRSTLFSRRSSNTHAWGSTSEDPNPFSSPDVMTMSCPSPHSLEEHVRGPRADVPRDPNPSPVVVKGRGMTSPSSLHSRDRPSSAHSYDGGLFLSAGGSLGHKDSFVIHPDWVSEAMTVHKLSLNTRAGHRRPQTRSSGSVGSARRGRESGWEKGDETEGRRRYRRSKSAPPCRSGNVMTGSP